MTLERLIRVAQTALEGSEADLGHVTAQTRLQEDLGLNSITMLMLMIGIEDEFSIRFPTERLPELRIYGRAERKLLRAPDEIAAAALSAVGRGGYDYRTNNCEHFSNECAFGEHYSRQSGEGNE